MLNVGFVLGFVCKNWFSSIWWFEIISYSTSKYNCFANHVKHVEFWSIQEKKIIDKKKIIPGLGSRFLEACYRKQMFYRARNEGRSRFSAVTKRIFTLFMNITSLLSLVASDYHSGGDLDSFSMSPWQFQNAS